MEHATVEELESFDRAGASVRSLTEALGPGDVSINHYTLEEGDRFSIGMYTHVDQEEIFYVIEGDRGVRDARRRGRGRGRRGSPVRSR